MRRRGPSLGGVYEIAFSVAGCLRAGTRVDVAWAVAIDGFGVPARGEALAITPGGGRVGSLLAGAVNEQLADLVVGGAGRLVTIDVSDFDAMAAGLPRGGHARFLLVPATALPSSLWERLAARDPVCLVTRLDGDEVVGTALFDQETVDEAGEDARRLWARGASDTAVAGDIVTTVLWPVPRLVVVGAGPVVDVLDGIGRLLGWQSQVTADASAARGLMVTLAPLDKVVVATHDDDLAGPALAAALASDAGYIGAMGSRRTQAARAQWLADRGLNDLSRLHGPAGLDIGANSPAEIAVSIMAEAVAVSRLDLPAQAVPGT